MKIVKSREDIVDGMWCLATEGNFNALLELGFASRYHDTRNSLSTDKRFANTDIFKIDTSACIFGWHSGWIDDRGEEISFDIKEQSSSLSRLGFIEPETFKVEILKIVNSKETEYIGVVNENIPAKWNSDGVCLNPGKGYSLFREYKQRIYTKDNILGCNPKQKFKISWTEKMSLGLETSGWRLATNEEIESFKI